jgi:hypothetical protein
MSWKNQRRERPTPMPIQTVTFSMTAWPVESDHKGFQKDIDHLVEGSVSGATFDVVNVMDHSATLQGQIRANEYTTSNKHLARYLEEELVSTSGIRLSIEVTIWD